MLKENERKRFTRRAEESVERWDSSIPPPSIKRNRLSQEFLTTSNQLQGSLAETCVILKTDGLYCFFWALFK